jgi:5,10-methylenetetrahydromethanopterin reductase
VSTVGAMRIGLLAGGGPKTTVDDLVSQIRSAADDGFSSAWLSQIFGWDALTVLAVAGREVPGIELGTAVVPTYPRHPMVLAAQALTTSAATGGRLVLGIGLSHQIVIEGMLGLSFEKPARHMREYLSVLLPLLHGEHVQFEGETVTFRGMGSLEAPGAEPPTVLLAALAPRMLELAGSRADGTVTWMTGPATIEDHIGPSIRAAADKAGKPAPRIAVGLPVSVTPDPGSARETANKTFAVYGQLPSYRAMLDKEGAANPGDVAIVGDEEAVRAGIQRVFDAGGTEFSAAVFGSGEEMARTRALLKELAG